MPKEVDNKYRAQNYRREWEKERWAQGWLSASKNHLGKAYCFLCDKHLVPGKSELMGHRNTSLHVQRAKTGQQNQLLSSFAVTRDSTTVKAELNVVVLIARKNISLNFLDSLVTTLHGIADYSKGIREMTCNPTKEHASKVLSKTADQLIHDIYNFFKMSPNRQKSYAEFQKFVDVDTHRILKPSQTRWLSVAQCVGRILEQYPALSNGFQLHRLVTEVERVVKILCQNFRKPIENLTDINVDDESRWLPLNKVYPGILAEEFMKLMLPHERESFQRRSDAPAFIMEQDSVDTDNENVRVECARELEESSSILKKRKAPAGPSR
ncbi:hypothetical protein Pmani_021100 [Petrolisthes manimaculis]|uniref:Uncharacterized protein n=1 Tax=Petrolisthes manimaculis TaxID=1843537 RepID=A0AAE1PFK2_9EUCA|nr:hypothetical protein Pmani_021100 [Petrolisthes manimaculis]